MTQFYCLGKTKHTYTFSGYHNPENDAIYPPDTTVKIIGYYKGDPVCEFPNPKHQLTLRAPYEVEVGI